MTDEKKRILFVDDEVNILQGLKRMLRPMRKIWDVHYADSGTKGLEIMEGEAPFDAVVSDMRMPGMDGVEFLSRVMERYPQVVRFGLSGYSDSLTILKAANVSHQFLSKPCDPEELKKMLDRAMALRQRLRNSELRKALLKIGALPALPALYQEVIEEVQSPDPSIARIGSIIKKDVGMSAKVLQITNSAYMGLRKRVSDPGHAVSMLGLDHIREVILMVGAFSAASGDGLPKAFRLDLLWEHSIGVAEFAKRIALLEDAGKEACEDSFSAGLLHAIGLLILAARMPDIFVQALDEARLKGKSLVEVERQLIGVSHAEVGGCLLELWGLGDAITEAVTFHNFPEECLCDKFGPLAAVHAANYLRKLWENENGVRQKSAAHLNRQFLTTIGLEERCDIWQQACIGEIAQPESNKG